MGGEANAELGGGEFGFGRGLRVYPVALLFCGAMKGKGNVVIVREDRGQFLVTIPRALARALGLKRGDRLEFTVEGPDVLRVRLIRQEKEER